MSAFFVILSVTAPRVQGCTFVSMAKGGLVLVGYNEDFLDLRTALWLFPAKDKAYGRMLWGYDRPLFPYQGGMNEKGLFVDFNFVGVETGWKPDPDKPDLADDPTDYLLSRFAAVDEVVEFFRRNDVDLNGGMFVVADAKGRSAVIEWANGQLQVLHNRPGYQVCTNDLLSPTGEPFEHSDIRWKLADKMLRDQTTASVGLIRRVLSATCAQFDYTTTLYSTICDLADTKVYLYHFHNFEEVVVLDLKVELAKGAASHAIPGLFQVHPYSFDGYRWIGRRLGDVELRSIIDEKGIQEGLRAFRTLKDQRRTYPRYIFQDWVIKSAALHYLGIGKLDIAIELFKLNAQEYPDSAEVYIDLAESYLKKNDIPLAKENYQKALEKKPGDKRIEMILRKLK
ncbi:MAG: linear amide C-N hydrolase [Candidatus Aminicenantes bacterium]|nr:linear amide C-N hydrolase [Candidatus Aminicenantes bacterium]